MNEENVNQNYRGHGYTTPIGTDERRIPYPVTYSKAQINELKRRGIYFINWHGTAMAYGPGMGTKFYDEIARKRNQRESIIIAMLGAPGKGKTWSGLRLCEILDKKFDVAKQVCFSREHFMKIISGEIKIEPGQAILLDEAHLAAGARHWWDTLQQDLVDQIATIRSLGIILIIVVLHLDMIDSIIRKFVLTYQLHMERRGVVTQYSVTMPRFGSDAYHPREGKISLSVPGIGECASPECLWCPDRKIKEKGDGIRVSDRLLPIDQQCMNMRCVYERAKQTYLTETRDAAIKKAEAVTLKENPLARENQLFELLYENKDQIEITKKGGIENSSVREILAANNIPIGRLAVSDLCKRLLIRYPDLKSVEENAAV